MAKRKFKNKWRLYSALFGAFAFTIVFGTQLGGLESSIMSVSTFEIDELKNQQEVSEECKNNDHEDLTEDCEDKSKSK